MSEIEFLLHLRALGVKLWLEGDAVKFSAPRGALTPDLKDELKARKEEIRSFLLEAARMAGDGPRTSIAAVPRDAPLPLSFGQERLWFLAQLEPESGAYAIPAALRLDGPLDADALQRALTEIVRRHETLRTTFSSIEGQPVAVIHESSAVTLPITDLAALAPAERELAMRREIGLEARRSFDLERGPLLRARLLRLGPEEHVLLSAMHHIVSDGWSSNVFARELGALYDAFAAGKPSPLPDLPIQYVDFAAWQRGALAGDVLDRQLAHWTARLAGAPAAIDLPTDRPRPPLPSLAGSWRRFTLSPALSEALRELAQREGVTLFMLLLAAFDVLLARMSGQDDLVVGSPIAGRARPETEPLIGFFVNTLVLRAHVAPDASFRDLLAQVKATCLDAYAHQDLPFERLVQALAPERDPSRSPLFQVLFSLQNAGREAAPLAAPLRRRGLAIDSGTAKFDLTLAMADAPSGLYGVIEYATDLFEASTIDRLGTHFTALLEGLARDPAQPTASLPILPAAERRTVVETFNATRADYPNERLLHELFAAQAARTPEAIALVFEGQTLTYGALDRRSNQLARALQKRGVGPDVLVGVCCERSIELVVALYGVLRAGGAYVPLDPEYPKDRLAFMLEDARVPVLLTQAHLEAALPPHGAEVLRLDSGWPAIAAELDTPVERGALGLRHLAYVIYTSGSTGRPKGAMNEHRGVLNRLQWMQSAYELTSADRVLQKTPFSFDVSVWELFWPLLFGATLVVARPEGHKDPAYLAELIAEQRITTLHFVPSMLKVFLEELEPHAVRARCASLKRVFASGEALVPATVDAFFARLPGASLHNLYGPTEAAVDVTAWACRAGSAIVPIGKPIANARIYLLDARREPVPIGVRGELFIGGVQVGRGYLNRPDLTADRFVPDPFVPEEGYPLYRTGDVARWLPTGDVEYLGRSDFQVKIRGFRIELGEIEAALAEHPSVREVVVVAREDAPGERKLVAYLAPSAGASPTAPALRDALRARLPEHMVPSSFVVLDALPLTASGKIDRRALPAPEAAANANDERGYVAPRGPIEAALAAIFAEVLEVDAIGAHDGFFDRGGHSLLATRVMARVRAAFAVDLPLRALFDAPAPAALAARVEAALLAGSGVAAPPLTRAPRGAPLPLSFAQERLWFLDQLEPGDPSYVVPTSMHLEGALDVAVLERALAAIVERHEPLRTTFAVIAGQPVQVIHDDLPVALAVTSLTSLPASEREAAARRALAAEAARPFDLTTGPLLRARLFQLSNDDHVLSLALHHIVSDAWTLGILNRELSTLYRALLAGAPAQLPALPIQYADYAVWQRAWLAGDVLEAQLAYWREHLHGAPASLDLPTDRPRPATPSHRGAHRSFAVSADVTAGLEALARRESATLFMTLLTAFDVLLHRLTEQRDVVVGTPIAGRTRAETEGLIGFFVNTLVLRAEIDPEQSFLALLARVKETCLGAYAHQDLPFERLVQELALERDPSRTPLFQVAFVLQNATGGALALDGVRRRGLDVESATSKFDLTLAMARTARGTLAASIEYAADLFDASTIDRLVDRFAVLLAGIVAAPEQRAHALPILPEPERRLLLDVWSGKRASYPRDASLAAVFEAQVDATPEAVAVVFGDTSLTYRALDRRANQLAHALREQGVGPETRVGLFARRSLEMVIATLGILKAGGAYVPLDPGYPPQRLAFLCDDAGIRIIVTACAPSEVARLGESARTCLDATAAALATQSDARLAASATGASLAYVMYTSGSTGTPKGVLVLHRGVARLVKGTDYTRFAADEVFLQLAPLSFDAATFEIWGPLLNGGTLALFPSDPPDLDELGDVILRHGVTTLWLTAGLFNAVVESDLEALRPLRRVLAGGDALSVPHVKKMLAALPEVTLINGYGPTEGTTFTACHTVTEADTTGSIPIGRPIANTQVFVLDAHGQLAPIGVPGELYVGGDGVARGYLARPELTAERFVSDPFGGEGVLYRTGDVARFRESGELLFLGRRDAQVKIRGYRIELGEIEAVLGEHPSVRAVSVVAREDIPGDKRLVAYVVGVDAASPSTADLKAFLAARLPEHLMPSAFVTLPALPLNENGKVDRRALPAPEAQATEERAHVAPRGPIEQAIAEIFADILKLPEVSAHDGFFDRGGHSLLATQAIGRVRAALGVALPLRALFEATTPAALAQRVEALLGVDRGALPPPLVAIPRAAPLALSFGEERLWFLDQLEPGDASYVVPLPIHLVGPLDRAALHRALAEVVRRHEILRTTYAVVEARPVVVVHAPPALDLDLAETSLTALPAEQRAAAARAEIAAETQRPFDLAAGPLLRARLLVLGPEDHVLLLALHHIVTDGWSMGVLDREIAILYAAFARGEPSPLPELAIQYADYAAWQRAWLAGEVLEAELAYWKAHLADSPRALDLPTDRPRPPVQTSRGARRLLAIPASLTEALADLARREGVTLFMTLLAALDVLLHRYAGQDDLVVGTPIANRTRPETEGLIGFFVNTLALRVRVAEGTSFRALLAQVKETCLGAYAHQDLPFERLVQELEPARDPSRSPIFQVMFALQNAPKAEGAGAGASVRRRELATPTVTAKFDLTLTMVEGAHGLSGGLEYNVDLFDAATIERMAAHFLTLLEAAVADPERLVGELPLLPESERRALLAWSGVTTDFPVALGLHELFERQVDRTPDAVAVTIAGAELTYRELDERANRLAQHLLARGVAREELVGLAVHRSLAMVVAILGVLKAGGAYLPLDPEYPRERLAFMIEDAQIGVLLTEADLADALPAHGAQVIRLDAASAEIAQSSAERPVGRAEPQGLAYVIYTSGSTGKPKGVQVTHANVARLFTATDAWYRFDASDVWTMFHSYAFDFSVWEIWGALLHGGRLVLVPYWISREPAAFYQLLGDEGVTVLNQTPSAFRQLAAVDASAAPEAASALRLRCVIFGGEALDLGDLRGWWERHGDTRPQLVNMYGITETTVHVTYRPVNRADLDRAWSSVIGRPIPDLQVHVLDARRELTPIGVPGEMYVGGAGVARGYLRRPELTAERFLPDPRRPEKLLYRTGDRARVLANGDIEYLGRVDQQVKIRGFRIEPGEIEAVIDQHPAVRESVVLAREDTPGDKRLVGYLVCSGAAPPVAALRAFLKERLPDYMVPAAFVFLGALPLNENGKIDRRALPAPESTSASDSASDRSHAAPRGPIEQAIAAIFAETLHLDPDAVSAHDGFFDRGGHSLLATQAIGRVRAAFDVDLPLRALFEAPTPAELSARVEAALRADRGVAPPAIVRVPREEATALSFGQERLWFLDQLEPGDPSYILPEVLRFEGALDIGVLARALVALVERHEVLRTTFEVVNGRPTPVVRDDLGLPFVVTILRDLPADERSRALRREAAVEARGPFDLRHGPLIRARLLALADDDHALLLTMHHIVSDAWSVGVMNREILALYEAFLAGRPSPLPALPFQYGDYAHWQRSWFTGEALQARLDHVKASLVGIPRLIELPTDRPRPPVQSHRGSTINFALTQELGAGLQALARREGATLFMTLLAAFDVLLHRVTGQSDIVVGSPIAGRTRVETEALVGFFLNTLVLRAELSGDLSFRDLLARVKESCLDAYADQDLPFDRLVQEIEKERDLGRTPIFQVMFILQNAPTGGMAAPSGLTLRGAPTDGGTAKFDLTLAMSQRADGGLLGALEYAADLFDASTIERLLGSFRALLEAIVADPGSEIRRLPILDPAARRAVVETFNATRADYPNDQLLHELFAAQAARTPEAIALVFEGQTLTYGELDRRSNQLARALQKRGVGPDVLVGVCCERSIELVVALYGVLKAGGAYVPLDPEYPRDRLAFMLEDARVPVLLTQAHLEAALPPHGAEVLRLDSGWPAIAAELDTPVDRGALGLRHLAYVIYTSGSTGRPKGAMNEHRGVLNRLQWMQAAYELTSADRVLQKTPFSFDVSVWELFWPLLFGATLVVARPEGHKDPAYLAELIEAERITTLHFVPSMLKVFTDALDRDADRARCASLKRVYASGEALSPALADRFFARLPGAALHNLYGPTEAAVDVTAWACQPGAAVVPIGKPIANARIYLLDAHREPVPIGVRGELYIGGVQVARGYLNRAELTAERFVPDPFVPEEGYPLYRTGDAARWLPTGDIEYLGRLDFQVKIRGFRIELGEIEAALARHPRVREVTVLAREDVPDQKRLVAYLRCDAEGAPTVADLRAFLKDTLPEHMVPSAFVLLATMPLTSSGKVDRAALPPPERGGEIALGEDFVAARTAVEEELSRIWRAVLRRKTIGVHDNFFAAGGDSILSIQVVSRAQQAGLTITPRQIFQHQTIAELAEVASSGRVRVDAEQGPVTGAAPLTPIQRWWASLGIDGAHHWNQAFLLELSERLDVAALTRAVARLVEHHDALRLRLGSRESESESDAGLEQLFAPPGEPAPLRVVDLAGEPAATLAAAIEEACAAAQASLDLHAGPALRIAYLDLGPTRAPRLLLAIHHLAVDGVSWRILFEDLWSAYAEARAGREVIALPPKTTSFRRWAERLAVHAEDAELAAQLDFWLAQDRGGAARVPTDHRTGSNDEASARTITVSLDAEETEHLLRDVPEVYRTQTSDVLLTAFVEAFAGWTGARRVLVDLEGHGREELFADVDVTRTVGWFTSLFPVVLAYDPALGPGEALKSVKEQLRAVPDRGVGYGLLRWLRRDTGAALAALPEAEVLFNYLGQFDQPASAEPAPAPAPGADTPAPSKERAPVVARPAREAAGPSLSPRGQRTHLLGVTASVTGGRLRAHFTYSEDRHAGATIAALAAGFLAALRRLVAHCLSPAAGGATPSDFQNAGVTQDVIDLLAGFDPGAGGDDDENGEEDDDLGRN